MFNTVLDHGLWELYRPEVVPDGYPEGAAFARRVSDGQDWYGYVYGEVGSFTDEGVKATVSPDGRVQAIYRNASCLFPAGHQLIEILGVDPSIPDGGPDGVHKLFERTTFDAAAATFTPYELERLPPSLSDWRVGLIENGRFADVQARVMAARNSGSVIGAIAWERFEYANTVRRKELMRLRPVLNFTEEEVDLSLAWAYAVEDAA
ncbi:hypothetical protein [uncultured Methylobacterium sp.]|uniref:hypothetical protein n=1 Tax=uncultured Methylobacterium sp. TaxID=157278 RepID=UPI0035C9B8D7